MFRRITRNLPASVAAVLFAFFAMTGSAFAVVEINTADPSQLESIKGIGPALSGKILAERKQGNFKDWSDLETRVSGVGPKNAAGFSRAGLTVGGKAKDGVQASADANREGAHSLKTASKKAAGDAPGTSIAKK